MAQEPFFFVARGPVSRERWMTRARTMARDRPSPYGEGAFFIVARGPSDATRASERVSPANAIVTRCVSTSVVRERRSRTGQDQALLTYRAWRADDGEGQALALREGKAFFHRSAGHVTVTVERVIKHPY